MSKVNALKHRFERASVIEEPIYVVLFDWAPATGTENQMRITTGDEILVRSMDDSGWWYGDNLSTNEAGYFPETYVEEKPFKVNRSRGNTFRERIAELQSPRANSVFHGLPTQNSYIDYPANRAAAAATVSGYIPSWSRNVTDRNREAARNEKARIGRLQNEIAHFDPSINSTYSSKPGTPQIKDYTIPRVPTTIKLKLKENPNSTTVFCILGHYMGYTCGVCAFWFGIIGLYWDSENTRVLGWWLTDSDPDFRLDQIVGIYCFVVSLPILAYERYYGYILAQVSYLRPISYIALSILPILSEATILFSGMLWWTALCYYLAIYNGESFTFRKKRGGGSGLSLTDSIHKWFVDLFKQSKWQKYAFAVTWLLINVIVFFERFMYWEELVIQESGEPDRRSRITSWVSHAKAWGTVLDLNMAMILLPVSKSLVRLMYDYSTDQTKQAKCMRWILFFLPLDKSIQYHKLMALFIAIAALGHTWAHYMHYAVVWRYYENVYGDGVWVTGVALVFICQWIFTAALDIIRFKKFEMFYYIHHLFVFFYFITLFHGANWKNPNFWKYLLLPGIIYILERIAREINAARPIGVCSVTLMGSDRKEGAARVLCLELEKTGPIANYKEGQYCDIKCPIISRYQWHPFTISSAPQSNTVTFHIRDQGPGTWTNRLFNYFHVLAGMKTFGEIRALRNGRRVPQTHGPDGFPLIQISGPNAAPTQHLGEYSTCMIVGGGIGVTPVRATLQSVVHRFKYSIGNSYPDNAYFFWLCRHADLEVYAFMARTLKEASDALYDNRSKNPKDFQRKKIRFTVWMTSVPRDTKPFEKPDCDWKKDPTFRSFFGPSKRDLATSDDVVGGEKFHQAAKTQAPFDEWELYAAMHHHKDKKIKVGDFIHIERFYDKGKNGERKERPDWDEVFRNMKQRHEKENIGVMYCGPGAVADILKVKCGDHTDKASGSRFILHKENF